MAFLFFSGARPHEIRGEEAHRIWYWKNMRQWKEPSEKSGGIIFTVPDVDTEQGTGYSMSKPAHETERDLFPAGVEWMKWYFLIHKDEKKLPTTGSYKASGDKWKLIRAANGLGGEDPNGKNYWEGSNPRHLFASCVHRWKKSEKAYWLDVCAHTENVFQKNYKNPDVNKETATDFLFNILPPNINEERETKEKERESRIKYEMETNGWSRADAESIVDADPWATVE